jgi:hypothetical protein
MTWYQKVLAVGVSDFHGSSQGHCQFEKCGQKLNGF